MPEETKSISGIQASGAFLDSGYPPSADSGMTKFRAKK